MTLEEAKEKAVRWFASCADAPLSDDEKDTLRGALEHIGKSDWCHGFRTPDADGGYLYFCVTEESDDCRVPIDDGGWAQNLRME